jgi:hypothetical protein
MSERIMGIKISFQFIPRESQAHIECAWLCRRFIIVIGFCFYGSAMKISLSQSRTEDHNESSAYGICFDERKIKLAKPCGLRRLSFKPQKPTTPSWQPQAG